MIDLKKPLEGAPGLLLLASLILFGVTIGIAVALAWSWVHMSDGLANFLGGVVGAGLGAALAVLGAVYVQRLERRERLSPSINQLRLELRNLRTAASRLVHCLEMAPNKDDLDYLAHDGQVRRRAVELRAKVAAFSDYTELPRHLHEHLIRVKKLWEIDLDDLVEDLLNPRDQPDLRYDRALITLQERTIPTIERQMGMVDNAA